MKNRNIAFVIIMGIVTLGFYDVYWCFSTRSELVRKRQDVPSPWIVLLPLLGFVGVAILEVLVRYAISGNPAEPPSSFERAVNGISVLIGMVSVLGIIPMTIYWTWRYSAAVEKVTKGELTAGFNFALAILLAVFGGSVVWPAINQYQFNKLASRKR
jgi:hypothetical protein